MLAVRPSVVRPLFASYPLTTTTGERWMPLIALGHTKTGDGSQREGPKEGMAVGAQDCRAADLLCSRNPRWYRCVSQADTLSSYPRSRSRTNRFGSPHHLAVYDLAEPTSQRRANPLDANYARMPFTPSVRARA